MKRPLPRGMREERERLETRREHVRSILRWIGGWDIPGVEDREAELADLDKRLAGFARFCDGDGQKEDEREGEQ